MTTKTPSLGAQLRQFFADNPTEMLTHGDIAVKFGAPPSTIKAALQNLRKQGHVKLETVVMAA